MGWLTGWTYRKSHIINPASGAGQNYQKRIVVHYGAGVDNDEEVYLDSKCKTDFGDIRFTNNTGAFLLDYWIEKKVNNNYAICWVKIIDDLNSYNVKIYIYYGNAGVVPISNGDSVFIFFDDFETNLDKWSVIGGKSGLRFNGSNNLGSPTGFDTVADFDGYSPFTLECWFKTTNSQPLQPIVGRMNNSFAGGNGRGYFLYVTNNHIGYELRNSCYDPSNEIMVETNARSFNDGNKHHLVATYDGSQLASGVHIYVDNIEEPFTIIKNTLNGTIKNPSRFQVASYLGFYYFTGDIDELVVYTSVLTPSDISARYNNGEGTEEILSGVVYAHYPMDEGSGEDVIDVSGHPERNLWLSTVGGGLPVWVSGMVDAPMVSLDYAYSGTKCVKFQPLQSAVIQKLVNPFDGKATHVHFYDQLSPLVEYAVFSNDAGESEVSYIGIQNDIAQYEYELDGVTYNSGIDRAVGWHEFVTRSSGGLKQFLVDGSIMPVTGIGNYNPVTSLFGINVSEVNTYWDTVFIRKWTNPEPAHGTWGVEETGAGITTFNAEDIVQSDKEAPMESEDTIYSLLETPESVGDIMYALSGSLHIPILSEDMVLALTRLKTWFAQDIMLALSGSLHVPILSENILVELLRIRIREVAIEFGISEQEIVNIIMTTQGELLRRLTSKLYEKL